MYKYQGAGNDFLLADNRDGSSSVSPDRVAELCDRRYGIGADGLMLLESSGNADFRMVYYNSDGSGGMMCGNGGRCITAFAADLGIVPSGKTYVFEAADGLHNAEIIRTDGLSRTVRLKMKDVHGVAAYGDPSLQSTAAGRCAGLNGYFLDTGTRHFVKFVHNLGDYDVAGDGRAIRYSSEFATAGTNANFVEPVQGILNVRTYEKGVEDETFACGTGITAAAIATFHCLSSCPEASRHFRDAIGRYMDGRVHIDVRALKDSLSVDFRPSADGAEDVWLTGPAAYIAEIISADRPGQVC